MKNICGKRFRIPSACNDDGKKELHEKEKVHEFRRQASKLASGAKVTQYSACVTITTPICRYWLSSSNTVLGSEFFREPPAEHLRPYVYWS